MSLTHYRGNDVINPDDLEETYLEDIDIKGNVVKQFRDSLDILTKKLLLRSVVSPQSGFRHNLQSIPVIALREVLANSLIHRDYIYIDRLEISNPGENLIPIHRLDKDPSITRNPLLLAYMKEIKLAEQKARGIRTIKNSLKKAGLPEPRFENLANSFKVTIYRSVFMLNTDPQLLKQLARFNLNHWQINRLDKDDVLARKDLMQLLKLNLIYARGSYKKRRYYLNFESLKKLNKDAFE